MKTLPQVIATAEQLPLISQNRLGVEVICGAAGSGKTSTALLRLRSLTHLFAARFERQNRNDPVRVLVLTFNRTLAGYVRSLAEHQIEHEMNVDLHVDTFGHWSMSSLGYPNVDVLGRAELRRLATGLGTLAPDYVMSEADYLLGRFEPERLEDYLTMERTGRGAYPRVDRSIRRRILSEVVAPYKEWLVARQALDWNDVAVRMARDVDSLNFDIVIVDESQDFSANQLRAIAHHLSPEHAVTFVIDTVQRIYARGFTWAEAGFDVRPGRIHTLRTNHRNTAEIAAFAAGVLDGIDVEGDGALPNLNTAARHGPLPIVLRGRYSAQIRWAVRYIRERVDLENESVAFLKPQGGTWFDEVRRSLTASGIDFVEITRESEWPEGEENVALSTFHSAKGLEFDYVFILGFNDENTPHEGRDRDDKLFVLQRLLAVAVARAREAVVLGYKPGEESRLVRHFVEGTFEEMDV